ncbi:tripartite tricarboxylate transporter substrate binding protein [Variovorax paradoxus]|uniref:Bug family tripartite tricarboxylate transporter substrate binding protein n=1 Tax=Variovorax paradoxus TaxID=34073 RepID=UPI00037770EA|nr:tripartite tricarboxylate transporter substrate binding protein [Variovorax paradoxus]
MKTFNLLRGLAALVAAVAVSHAALAADAFPTRPVRIVVNTAPGGLTDITTRLVAQQMGEALKQPVIVDNRAGGDGLIGIRAVKSAPADGYTLLATAGTIALQMAVREDPGYDLVKDFTGVGLMGRSPYLMVVAPTAPYKTLGEYVAAAKANPGKVTYASAGVGTAVHLATERWMHQLGIKLMHVPYKGNGAAMPDVMAGRVDMILEAYGSSSGKLKGGQLRALGVTSTSRISALPDVPTFAEAGAPGYSYYTWLCIVAPAGTPKDVVAKLSEALRSATGTKAVKDRFRDDGVEAMNLTPDEFNQFLAREVTQAQAAVTELGLPKQ